jgi:tripartite-type tricarboxylate transporter receptor subunit TctC
MKRLIRIAAVLAMAGTSALCAAQSYPARPVKLVVPLSQGSATDTLSRLIAQKLGEAWGQTVVVENQPGANGIPATAGVVKAAPDGYTLIMIAANHVINASLYSKLPYDTLKDVKPIVRIAFTPLVLSVHPSVPAKSLAEFIALARAQPGKLNFGSAGSGSATHLAGEMFKTMAGVNLTHVPYKAVSQAQTDLMGGQIESMFVVLSAAIPQINAGKIRGLGVTSAKRVPQLPQVPSVDEAGVPGFEVLSWIGLAGPAGMPEDVVNKIHADVAKIVNQPEIRERIIGHALQPALMPPREFATFMATDQSKWAEVVKASGARAD